MQAVQRQFDPYPGDPPAEEGQASSWEELLQIPWVQRRSTKPNFGGWWVTSLGPAAARYFHAHPNEVRGRLQGLIGERGGFVLGYLHFENLVEYDTFTATVPVEYRR